jgi:hypothetical protein
VKLLEQLKTGKKVLKLFHIDYKFTIKANIKLDNESLIVDSVKISLPQRASKGEKLLLKLVQIYCYDVLQNNLIREIYKSQEFERLQNRIKK